jgi:hypothetical protein
MPIFDQGYQHWQGQLSGHAWRWFAIARHGVRVQMNNRLLRILLLLAWLPAVGLAVAVALWGLIEQRSSGALGLVGHLLPPGILSDPREFRLTFWTLAYWHFFEFEMYFIMLLAVISGPGLISRDLRFNALPLYFARPLTRLDYFLGKLGVIAALVGAVAIGPAVFAYVIGVCFSLDLSVVKDTYPVLLASVAYGVVITLAIGPLMLAMSSLTRRSLYVGIAWAGMWVISGAVGPGLTEMHRESVRHGLREEELNRWVAEHPPPPGIEMRGPYPMQRYNPDARKNNAGQQTEADRWMRAWSEVSQQAWAKADEGQTDALRRNWRPMCSFVANLERIAHALLGTDAAYVKIGEAMEGGQRVVGPMIGGRPRQPANTRRLADQRVPQYPWVWSAGLLTALMGISVWTLTWRVKSLDRLK